MQLNLLAPAIVGLVIGAAGLIYAYWLSRSRPKRRTAPPRKNRPEDGQLPFDLNPSPVSTAPRGTIPADNTRQAH